MRGSVVGVRGVTFLELLVVIAIVGVIAGILIVSLRTPSLKERAERVLTDLRLRFDAVCDEAELTGTARGMTVGENTYELVKQTGSGAWLSGSARAAPISLAPGFAFELRVDGVPVDLGPEPPAQPSVRCFPSGEMTPFELGLVASETGERVASLEADLHGQATQVSGD